MTAPTDLLARLDSDPAAGILAAADLREQRIEAASSWVIKDIAGVLRSDTFDDTAEHIAAEANPAHARAAARRWRGVVERHVKFTGIDLTDEDEPTEITVCNGCGYIGEDACPDLTETADEARAYLGGGQ